MTGPRVFKLDEFKGGRILAFTEEGGSYPVTVKEDGQALVVDITYPPGALVLYDDRGTIVGPFAFPAVLDLAERVLDGDARSICDSRTLLTLAAAVVGFTLPSDPPQPEAPVVAMEAAHV